MEMEQEIKGAVQNKTKDGAVKITVTALAENCLGEMLIRVNDEFSGGQLTRQELASWILSYFQREAFTQCIEQIRSEHFDQLIHFEGLLKQARLARKAGAPATEIAAILAAVSGPVRPNYSRKSKRVESGERSVDAGAEKVV